MNATVVTLVTISLWVLFCVGVFKHETIARWARFVWGYVTSPNVRLRLKAERLERRITRIKMAKKNQQAKYDLEARIRVAERELADLAFKQPEEFLKTK